MTGEISLRGRVLRVGGIKEKVLAASRFGIEGGHFAGGKQIGLAGSAGGGPRAKLKVHFVQQISEVLRLALAAK